MKYFPDRPADVTCATCPYLLPAHGAHLCMRYAPDNPMNMDDPATFCGDHPWFAQERATQDEKARCRVRAIAKAAESR